MKLSAKAVAALFATMVAATAHSQAFPTKPVRIDAYDREGLSTTQALPEPQWKLAA